MSVLFSKVDLQSDTGNEISFLCCGTPRKEEDLYGWAAFEDFIAINRGRSITAKVKSYVYGDGEEFRATIYEVASYTQRGERFFGNPNVKLKEELRFTF